MGSFPLMAELDVPFSDWDSAGAIAWDWLRQGVDFLEPAWQGEARMVIRSLAVPGNFHASTDYSAQQLLDACARINELSACEVAMYHETDGAPTGGHVIFSVHNPSAEGSDSPRVLKLSTVFDEKEEVDRYERFERRLKVLQDFCGGNRVEFGHVSHYLEADPITALERGLNLRADVTLRASNKYIRGYSWVTVISSEIAELLGGVDRLDESGAFSIIRECNSGAIWLQATRRWAEYDMASVRRVFDALRSVIYPGLPHSSPLRRLMPELPPEMIVFEEP